MTRIEELKDLINKASDAYYNLTGDIISDNEYDALVKELKELEPNNEVTTQVGAPVIKLSVWDKVAHTIPMGSLNKANSSDEFTAWADKTGSCEFMSTHKIDGSSMELIYEKGKLIRCVTRGDGNIGEDVTQNISKLNTVPKNLPDEIDITVRGEVVMMKSVFDEKYSEEYANPRNTAAGKVRDKKGESCKDLNFIAYWVMTYNNPDTMAETFSYLNRLGFNTPEFSIGDIQHTKQAYETISKTRESIPYEIDGVVVSVNNMDLLNSLGSLNLRPNGQIAWKFEASTAESTVDDVIWQVGLTGRITPVAIIKPVNIEGVTIRRISMHNLAYFTNLKLSKNCRILISRRNGVIPYIEKNLDLDLE
jgi:DNA ligase (NAD+)